MNEEVQPKFKVGDIVRLIKQFDSPQLMVLAAPPDHVNIEIMWFDIHAVLHSCWLPAALLELVDAGLPAEERYALPLKIDQRKADEAADKAMAIARQQEADRVRFAHTEGIDDA